MTLNILHVHSSFDPGGKELRAARLINAFGDRAGHSIVSSMPGALGGRAAIDPGIKARFPEPPPLTGRPSVERYREIARFMRDFDLVLTYNWGAIDAVLARRMFGRDVPPVVHHEDGFNEDEASGLKRERNWLRRLALPAAHALVVPSRTLERIAREAWRQPAQRTRRIANGIDVARYARKPAANAIPGFTRRRGEFVVGTVAGLRAVKDLPRLVSAFAALPPASRLVIVGEGPERETIVRAAQRASVAERVHLPGFLSDPQNYVGLFDVFALSSRSEQAPISLIEAMAAGLPVVAPDVGDIRAMVSAKNAARIGDLTQALIDFQDAGLREIIGAANRAKAAAEFDESTMIASYAALYAEAARRPGALAD